VAETDFLLAALPVLGPVCQRKDQLKDFLHTERLLSCMNSYMFIQMGRLGKSLTALSTAEGFDSSVNY
jgi:hypothetical protein